VPEVLFYAYCMSVKYFRNIIEDLLEHGLTQTKIADAIGFKKQNITEILQGIRQDMQGEQLSRLIALCKKEKLKPSTWSQLGDMIDRELKNKSKS